MSTTRTFQRILATVLGALVLGACGGGGGGGGGGGSGGGGGGGGQPSASVTFQGITFRIGDAAPTSKPPVENLNAAPPKLGAPLDVTIIFNFSGVPQGPFGQQNLPVFTTPSEVTPEAGPSAATPSIPAKGTWVAVGNTVEFRPFLPTEPLQVDLSAPPAAVPGLLPASTYTARVIATTGQKIPNLKGAGGQVKFDTTSIPGGYFTGGGFDGLGPQLVSVLPADGTTGLSPGPYSNFAPGATVPSFPDGEPVFQVSFDRALLPSDENLGGRDWDGDGWVDPTFFVRSRATRLLVAQSVPAGSSIGNAQAFPALAGLTEGAAVPADGSAIFLHDSQGPGALPGADPVLSATPVSLATGRDPALLFVVLGVDGGSDLLAVADHVLGDPAFADLSSAALDTGLDDLTALTLLPGGRLVAYDRTTRRLYELLPVVERSRPLGEPVLSALTVGDGITGFLSDTYPAGTEVLDLAVAPDGGLWGLLQSGAAFPRIERLVDVDVDLDGAFLPGEGLPTGNPALQLADDYAAIRFVDGSSLLALNRGTDAIDRVDLFAGPQSVAVSGVGAYGVPLGSLPGGLSPALDLEVGTLDLDVAVEVLSNGDEGAVVQLDPVGILPIDARIDVMARNTLAATDGTSASNQDPEAPLSAMGAQRLLSVFTSAPLNTVGPCSVPDPEQRVNDALDETFDDASLEDTSPTGLSPLADWAGSISTGGTPGKLRASVGVDEETFLGDFLPQALANFDPTQAFRHPTSNNPNPSAGANFNYVFLNTDAQAFPLPNGETPGVTQALTIFGGHFTFRDFIIPEGVWVIVKGSNPLRITATGRVEIAGMLDLSGADGFDDDTFDSGVIPVPGGSGGPGAGRGGDGQPTIIPANAPTSHCTGAFFAGYATPETGERGWGPVITGTGQVIFDKIGGHGGISTLGYEPDDNGFPDVKNGGNNTEYHRPPGGGGGTFYQRGIAAHTGSGTYRVQSEGGAFTQCPTNNKINDALYGTEELQFCCGQTPKPLQCVYMQGTPENPVRIQPGGAGGNLVFTDGDPGNDYFGGEGELQVLIGGQGGGAGGSRIDSLKHTVWSGNPFGAPPVPPNIPCYPQLFIGFYTSPANFDAKGGAGGGGGGSVLIRSFGDILLTRTGHIDATGGNGGGGEIVGNSNYSGAGGGGSGGAVILQAAGEIVLDADSQHIAAGYQDITGAHGASIEVSGGFGYDARTLGNDIVQQADPSYEFTRSDGGQGGFGLIQLQEGSGDGMPTIRQGAFAFAKQRSTIKRYRASSPTVISAQNEHTNFTANKPPPDSLRFIDIHYYRSFKYEAAANFLDVYYVLNGSDPPVIEVTNPGGILPFQLDTPMVDHFGRRLVREPEPQKILRTYNGYDAAFKEIGVAGQMPGQTYLPTDEIPLSIYLKEPDGTPPTEIVDGQEQFVSTNVVDRLPLVHPGKTPPEFGTVSRGTSRWIDFNGVALRTRDVSGLAPPLFAGILGTYNELLGAPPVGKAGEVVTANPVPSVPAKFVANTGFPPFDPGLCGNGSPPDPPYNDIKVDSPEYAIENAITNNASVKLLFQGAFPVRSGSSVPDPDSLSGWVADLRELSGYPLVRFQVVFDVAVDAQAYPFGPDSLRPAVDRVRLRVEY